MRGTVQRALLKAAGRITLDDAPTPQPGEGELLLRVRGVGICGSDIHMFRDGQIGGIRIDDAGGPFVPGHEASGLVEAVGKGVEGCWLGRRVAIEPTINCGRCSWCLAGQPNVCPEQTFLGLPGRDGALRQYMTHPARLCVPINDELDDDEVVMLEPLAIAVHALDRACWSAGHGAVVLGAGPIGLSIVCLLASCGADPIIVTDKLDYRLGLAGQLGATCTLNPLRDDVPGQVRKHGGLYGVPFIFEACGESETFEHMVACAAPAGVVAVVGISEADRVTFTHSMARRKGLDVRLVRRSNRTLERAMHWAVNKRLPLKKMVTHHYGLSDVQKAYKQVSDYADGVVKSVITP
jgi:L-iditol 2-dehydrogenase